MSRLIACIDTNWGIGFEGLLPWSVPSELLYFKALTLSLGLPLYVGPKTILPPLAGREVIMLSRSGYTFEDSAERDGVYIGGAEIFSLALDVVDTCTISVLPRGYQCDCFFPRSKLQSLFEIADVDYTSNPDFDVVTYQRKL